ncbi:MAG: YifB family Mg chelatase-like AAA ATPase [Pseudomonadaceae bacterium]|nr:YifB family Mg chelatase-like AAA ATPase [Pseudomonadaceae bacterium]
MAAPNGACVRSRAQIGLDAPLIRVEAHIQNVGLPAFTLVGLPEVAVKEAKDRVRSAMTTSGFDFPSGRITVNLAPADQQKGGSRFDLAMATAILVASGQLPPERLEQLEMIGELGLFGDLRRSPGALCAATAAARARRTLVLPSSDMAQLEHFAPSNVLACSHLNEVCEFLRYGRVPATRRRASPTLEPPQSRQPALSDVVGQESAKRALRIAAAGGHHLLMVGPPGSGKTMLASRLPGLLGRLDRRRALEVAQIYSIGDNQPPPPGERPFRAPHHSASAAALVGGGSVPKPGEITLAHNGVLFLDELPEFKRSVLDNLREPMESRSISLARAAARAVYPARFQLIAAMNPCPAGLVCRPDKCRCAPHQKQAYQSRLSGPLLDRIDLHVAVPALATDVMLNASAPDAGTLSAQDDVQLCENARQRAFQRQGMVNAELSGEQAQTACQLSPHGRDVLTKAIATFDLSMRSVHKILRISRTIADMQSCEKVADEHLLEALSYRSLDWQSS